MAQIAQSRHIIDFNNNHGTLFLFQFGFFPVSGSQKPMFNPFETKISFELCSLK